MKLLILLSVFATSLTATAATIATDEKDLLLARITLKGEEAKQLAAIMDSKVNEGSVRTVKKMAKTLYVGGTAQCVTDYKEDSAECWIDVLKKNN